MSSRNRTFRMGVDRFVTFGPVARVKLGARVWWWKVHHIDGVACKHRWMGTVEIIQKRPRMVVVRDRWGHEHVLEVGELIEPKWRPT